MSGLKNIACIFKGTSRALRAWATFPSNRPVIHVWAKNTNIFNWGIKRALHAEATFISNRHVIHVWAKTTNTFRLGHVESTPCLGHFSPNRHTAACLGKNFYTHREPSVSGLKTFGHVESPPCLGYSPIFGLTCCSCLCKCSFCLPLFFSQVYHIFLGALRHVCISFTPLRIYFSHYFTVYRSRQPPQASSHFLVHDFALNVSSLFFVYPSQGLKDFMTTHSADTTRCFRPVCFRLPQHAIMS